MGTDLVTVLKDLPIPAHLQKKEGAALSSAEAARGIKSISFPRISIAGSKFHVVEEGVKTLITDPDKPGQGLPLMQLEVVIVGWNPHVSKTYYEGEYSDDQEGSEPNCRSDDGIKPDADVATPVCASCALCPMNKWGSKVSAKSGKDVKACEDSKRIVILPTRNMATQKVYAVQIKPASLKAWSKYVSALTSKGLELFDVVTSLRFDPTADFPKLEFHYNRFLTPEEHAIATARKEGEDVKLIAHPRQVDHVPAAPALPAPAVAPAPAAQGLAEAMKKAEKPKAEAKPKPAPVKSVPPQDDPRIQHLNEGLKSTILLMGIDSEAGKLILKQFPAPAPKEPEKPVDPLEGLPADIKAAVTALGGADSAGGKLVIEGYRKAQAASKPAPAASEKPAEGFAKAPAGQVVAGIGDLASKLRETINSTIAEKK